MLVAGDPVGARAELPGLVRETCAFAASRGLRVAALGASPNLVALYRQAGFRSLYLGDEAIVDTRSFSLEGRSIGKVRQSVSRAEAAGYRAALIDHDRLDDGTIEELERVSERWRNGAPERGFPMAMDSLRGTHQVGSSIVAATDGDGRIGPSSTSSPPTAVRRCRCRSCGETAGPRTVSWSSSSCARSSCWASAAWSRFPSTSPRSRVGSLRPRAGSSEGSAGPCRWRTPSSRSRACCASTRSSDHDGSLVTSSTNDGAGSRGSASPLYGSKGSCRKPWS
jgi:hypothetical protein